MAAVELAAIGTVADVVPLVDENRSIVHGGLALMNDSRVEGIRQLVAVTKLVDKPALAAEDIAFSLGPRLNAAGRLNQASLGVELLVSESRQRVEQLAEYIHNLNSSRDSIERKIYKAAKKQLEAEFDPLNEPGIVVADRGWHQGVIGIVAGRLAEKYARPTVVISTDEHDIEKDGVGSARSALGINLYKALADSDEHLTSFGGHRAAAGCASPQEMSMRSGRHFLKRSASRQMSSSWFLKSRLILKVAFAELTLTAIREIEQLAPFGQENPRPVLCATRTNLVGEPKTMGESGRHLSVQLEQHGIRLRCVAFGFGDWAEPIQRADRPLDIVFQPYINEFRRNAFGPIAADGLACERRIAPGHTPVT